jgi:hypothetical protein
MTISDLIAKLSGQGVKLSADGDTLRWSSPATWPTPERLEFLRIYKAKIMSCLKYT